MSISFKLDVFEGPLDLLMHLIQKHKLNIYDINIAQITEQYLAYLAEAESMDLELSSEFLVMAANLLFIKSKMLLPKHDELEEEEDPRQELVKKLLEYSKYKELSHLLAEREHLGEKLVFKKPELIEFQQLTTSLEGLSVQLLCDAFQRILARRVRRMPPPKQAFSGVFGREKVSVSSKLKILIRELRNKGKVNFYQFFLSMRSRAEKVAGFLAVLELLKLNRIWVDEDEHKEITIRLKMRNR